MRAGYTIRRARRKPRHAARTIGSIGIVILAGTIIGVFLERSGGAFRLAASILRVTGQRNAPMAMSIMGYIVSIPVFCDSGDRLHTVGTLVQGLVAAVGVWVAGMLLL